MAVGGSGGRDAGALLPVSAVDAGGLVLRRDGVLVRLLELGCVNALTAGEGECVRVCEAMQRLIGRLGAGESLQLCVIARPLDVEAVAAGERAACGRAASAAERAGEGARAVAMRRLGAALEQSLRAQARSAVALEVRYLLACPWRHGGQRGETRQARASGGWARAAGESLRHVEGLIGELEAAGISARLLGGPEVIRALRERFDPEGGELGVVAAGGAAAAGRAGAAGGANAAGAAAGGVAAGGVFGWPVAGEGKGAAEARARRVASVVCTAPIDLSDRSVIGVGEGLERVQHVSLPPEVTWVGWLLHAMQAPGPWCVSVHVTATDRVRERAAQKRRYRRIWGVHRGQEGRGRPVDADAMAREREAGELVEELAGSAGAGIYRMSVYLALREDGPEPDAQRLSEACREVAGELSIATDVRMLPGTFAQRDLWRSCLPLGLDAARRGLKYVSANVADTVAPVGSSASSPSGVYLGVALPGRTLQRLDPFDPSHPNHLMLIDGVSGAGKTMACLLMLCRAICQGATGSVIDRAGHFGFLSCLVPGAVCVELGRGGAINPWDVPDPRRVAPEKVDYLLALHAALLGEHNQARDSYGLSDLESNLLGLAIGEVYARCAATGERPRELLLAEQLQRRYEMERRAGSVGIAESLRDLTLRLGHYVGGGPYAYLADRETSIPAGAPLVVFDTRSIPEAKAAAALLSICEHVKGRIERARGEQLAGGGVAHAWAGRSFLVIDEAWHLLSRPATGRWFNEFTRRSRHYALWLIAISQQLEDLDNEHGRALIANATMRLQLRQQLSQLRRVQGTLGLSEEAVAAIAGLQTRRGEHAMAYLANGSRGEASVQIAPGPLEYWIASSDPARDEPLRRAALAQAGGDAWRALALLSDPAWLEAHAERGGGAA